MSDFKRVTILVDAATGKQIDEFGSVVRDNDYFRLLLDETAILCCQFYDVNWIDGVAELNPHRINPTLTFAAFGDCDFDPTVPYMFLSEQSQDESNTVNLTGDWFNDGTANPLDGQLSFRVDTNTERFAEVLQNSSTTQSFYFCVTAIPSGQTATTVLAYFKFKAENRPSASTGSPVNADPEYFNAQEVQALVKSAPIREFSIDGATLWHSVQTPEDLYYREQRNGGEWSKAIALIVGPIGLTGIGVAPQGAYSSGTTYALNDGVTYNGSYYRSLAADNTGNQPDTSPASWELMVESVTGPTGVTGATNIDIVTPVIWDENFNAFAYQLSDIDSFVRFGMVKSMSALKLGVVSANPAYTGNAVVYPTTGRTELTQTGWTASTGVAGAYYRDADISNITFVTEDSLLIENAASVAGLVAGQWAIGDEDTIGSNRLYVYPTAGNDPTADGDGFYQYDTVSKQIVAVGATPAEITISKSFSNYKCLELWRDTFDANDTLNNGGVVVAMNILDGAEYSK